MERYLTTISFKKLACCIVCTSLTCIDVAAQQKNKINYCNQVYPGDSAVIFAPGIITTNEYEHSSPAFSPDGSVVLWTVVDEAYKGSMMEMSYNNGKWSAPYSPSFADASADDYYPSFSPDGKKLYFSSRRKVPDGYPATTDIRIWEVERQGNNWGKPVPFDTTVSTGAEYAHSISSNGTVYFSRPVKGSKNFDIRKANKVDGKYMVPEFLPSNINSTEYEDGPYIAPDESFLIFEAPRPEGFGSSTDLYISFKPKHDTWSEPINMGLKINTAAAERFARLSPDGKFLFFGSARNQSANNRGFDIFWIDAKIIDELRQQVL